MTIAVVSGGFDPLHPGHICLFLYAKRKYGSLAVIINSDEWLKNKHEVLLPQLDRFSIISSLACVDRCLLSTHTQGDVSELLEAIKPRAFVVGIDHSDPRHLPEYETCQRLGILIDPATHLEKFHSSSNILGYRKWLNPPVAVSALVYNLQNEKYLIIRRKDTGKLDLIGGFMEIGETPEDCLYREILEETKTIGNNFFYCTSGIGTYSDGRKITCLYYSCTISDPPQFTNEVSDFLWVDTMPTEPFQTERDADVLKAMLSKCSY